MIVEPFRPEHIVEIVGHDGFNERAALLFENSESAYTIRTDAATAILAGGVVDMTAGRGLVWSFVSPIAAYHAKTLHSAALRFIETLDYRRLEATCRRSFPAGARWLRHLGFRCETPDGMRGWGPDGTDYDLYSRVRE